MTFSSPRGRIRNRESRITGRSGVTLIELILVMIMLTLLAGILVPRMSDFFPALQVRESADLVFAWARKARADAALTGARHRLVFDAAGKTYWISYEPRPLTEPGVFEVMPGWEGQDIPDSITLEGVDKLEADSSNGDLHYFEFRPDGTAEGGTVQLKNNRGDKRTVRVEKATGQVTVDREEEENP